MFGSNKNKSKIVEDESIKDKSKFVVVGFTVMVFSFLVFVISEIYTSLQLSKQSNLISGTASKVEASKEVSGAFRDSSHTELTV